MIDELNQKLFAELLASLEALDGLSGLELFREQSLLISKAMSELSAVAEQHPFKGLGEEIAFHKTIWPEYQALLLFHTEMYLLCSGRPEGKPVELRKYYREKLKSVSGFLEEYSFHYQYFRSGAKELDALLYARDADGFHVLQPVLPGYGLSGHTPMSHLAARFLCAERFRAELLELIRGLEPEPEPRFSAAFASGLVGTKPLNALKWVGEVTHLIELCHGVYLTGQIDTEKIGIVEFFARVGEFFGVNLRVPKRGFDDLKARKTMSKTHFLDWMKTELLKKMEEEDALDRDRFRRRNGFF